MSFKAVKFISALVRWTDNTHESFLEGGNTEKDVWWIKTRFIISIFEDYLDPERSTSAKTSFDSDSQRRSTLIWGVIKGHLSTNMMLEKHIKDHPIVVGDYAQWLVSNSIRKESMETKVMSIKLKEKVDAISSSTTFSAKSINELNTYVASEKKAAGTTVSKLGSLAKR